MGQGEKGRPQVTAPPSGEPVRAEQPARRRRVAANAFWAICDQIVSSGTNFVLAFLVAHSVGASAFGAFSVAFAIFALAIGFARASITSPLGIRFSGDDAPRRNTATSGAAGASLLLGLALAPVLVGGALILGGRLLAPLVTLGLVLPGLFVQDAWRYHFFAAGRAKAAVLNDAAWGVLELLFVSLALATGATTAVPFLLAWGVAGAGAAALGARQSDLFPRPRTALRWLAENRGLTKYLLAEYVTIGGAQQVSYLVLGVFSGIATVGSFRGAQVILAPATVVVTGLFTFALPELSRRNGLPPEKLYLWGVGLTGVAVAMCTIWGSLWLLAPDSVGTALLGATWPGTHSILLPSVVSLAGTAATVGPATVIYSLGRPRLTLPVNVVLAISVIVGSLCGLQMGGPRGAAWGYAIAYWGTFPLWLLQTRVAVRAGAAARGLLTARTTQ